ncbi:30S ribosomal protein S16 [Candidatus Woesebacteria bacterium RIFCSPHIGHO2_01_FULL_44_10]|uniref:Small ribosomal subunit protein bS16 n=1 Tax=Candidatus Woesebacteria bacterium RIFCSPLOWO2_01_FULL_44_14 TaxID=1802525 RepID=A0A1F8BXK6_9BACT|nr:MAG: 30S ribosomal protein S16 [Candidatus Woesebacteria bacterium RIFCSPHIGHO2_01_FULL_44_10]OGM56432.1 MAG: 30S ribosomal protein S16 [Candidatus Woesebacteria bacterium RIFCSPHIGHO2_12_FULL_44_11]OGM68833.1 MAG: 30S ribosomal protein S16 [Candidatus Woesebacteria bacterium RIFCSPLOWO2_01_FULL_44_14]
MVRIRLARLGKRNDPFYRIVAIEKHKKNKGKFLEIIGHWFPKTGETKIDKKLYEKWLSQGAKPSEKVIQLIG